MIFKYLKDGISQITLYSLIIISDFDERTIWTIDAPRCARVTLHGG